MRSKSAHRDKTLVTKVLHLKCGLRVYVLYNTINYKVEIISHNNGFVHFIVDTDSEDNPAVNTSIPFTWYNRFRFQVTYMRLNMKSMNI
jgi:hypothetical protein